MRFHLGDKTSRRPAWRPRGGSRVVPPLNFYGFGSGCRVDKLVACQTCGLVQTVDNVPEGSVAKCARCHFSIVHRRIDSRSRTLAFSLAAAILYLPANLYPIVTAFYQGQHTQTTIFQGIKSLWEGGQYFISALVFCTSMFTPALKIIGLIFIAATIEWPYWKTARTWTYKIIRIIDPWNML